MARTVKAKIMNMGDRVEEIKIPKIQTLYEISRDYESSCKHTILLAKVNNGLMELNRTLVEDCTVEFLDITDSNGFRTYQRSMVLLMVSAAKEILGKKTRIVIEHSINKNYYCEVIDKNITITDKILKKIYNRMQEIVAQDLPIEKVSLPVEEGIAISKEFGLMDKVEILKYRRTANVNFYRLNGFYDYFYGPMVLSSGCLKKFDLHLRGNGFMLQFPESSKPEEFAELKQLKKLSVVFKESNDWTKILKVDTVGALNDKMCKGRFNEMIRIAEAFHEKKIAYIADAIAEQKKKVVLIAGPSSSGKTTFAERLCVQLRANGLRTYILSLDNYFTNRDLAPLDEYGIPDYDSFGFMDTEQLNIDLKKLLKGETVEIPHYNFHTGKREYNGKFLKLEQDEVLVLEGIHALNNDLTYSVPKSKKFKIFISALTQLNIDDHNRIPTTDARLIRRIVRDNQFRGTDAAKTISQWPSVLRGEAKNIFPFQEEADAFFNSALVYEMCILKQYIEPLLFRITKDQPQYTEARRLIKFLDSFIGANSEYIQPNSILREFIGGSCFNT